MKTKILDETQLDIAARIIADGGIVAFPTETVYGLGANALSEEAVRKIFAAKGRPSDNPLIVHIADSKDVDNFAQNINEKARRLMEVFWSGALTLVLQRKMVVPDIVTAGLDTVAIRMPSNIIAQEIIKRAGVPIAAPSANISGRPSPTRFEHVYEDLNGKVDVIVKPLSPPSTPCLRGEETHECVRSEETGECLGVESTVVDMTGDVPVLLRAGGVTVEQLEKTIGDIIVNNRPVEGVARAPGMKYRHYAPKAKIVLINQENMEYKLLPQSAEKIGILTFDEYLTKFCGDKFVNTKVISLGSKDNPQEVSGRLFWALREFDKTDVDVIYVPEITDDTGLWLAIKNRLYKAAGVGE